MYARDTFSASNRHSGYMELINDFFASISSFLWGWPMIIMLLGTHLFLTIRLRFPQRKIFTAIKLSVKRDKSASGDVVKGEAPEMDKTYLDAQFDDVHDAIHTENIKVYRNVQAAVDDSLADQTKAIRGYIERTQKEGSKLPLVLGIVNFALNIIILAVLILTAMGVF